MGDVFGGTFMLKLVIIFIVIYVSFATIAVSYAKTFRLKNSTISIVEQYQLTRSDIESGRGHYDKIDEFLGRSNYILNGCNGGVGTKPSCVTAKKKCDDSVAKLKSQFGSNVVGKFTSNGACITAIPVGNKRDRYYFRVTLYMVVGIPGMSYSAVFPISGDSEDYGDV